MKKSTKTILTVLLAILAVAMVVYGLFRYTSTYRRRLVSICSNENYELEIYQIGDAGFPFGSVKGRTVLKADGKVISRCDYELANDGKNIGEENFEVSWESDWVTVTVLAEEEDPETVIQYYDGSIMKVDSFLVSGKEAKGVVFYVDNSGMHGKAVALKDAAHCDVAKNYSGVFSLTPTEHLREVLADTNGYGNTLEMKRTAEISTLNNQSFALNAPGAYYCYYYDHLTQTTGAIHKGWYLPAGAELHLLYANRVPLNNTLLKIGGNTFESQEYYSSTSRYSSGFSSNTVWAIKGIGGKFFCYGAVYKYVRAIVRF